jgi:2TM domain
MFKDLSMRVFLAHLAAYVVLTAALAAINLWYAPRNPWFVWVLMGWGAAVATHALALLLRKTHRRERIFIDKCARSFTVHLFAYLATVLILLFVNLTVTPQVWWFYWVALGWGAGLIAHGWCAFGKRRRRAEGQEANSGSPEKRSESAPRRKSPKSS